VATTREQRPDAADVLKRLFVGRAFASHRLEHTLLPKLLALPVFASDPLSSVAYATEESMIVLLAVSSDGKRFITPISIAIASLLAIVVVSYRQTVRAYPNGGGAYIVSKDNLGQLPGLIAASALLVDYMMTVVVSVVAGVYAITSAAPALAGLRVELSIAFVVLVTFANLRGARESGILFAVPTYGFVLSILAMLAIGLARCVTGCPEAEHVEAAAGLASVAGPIGLFVLLRAFSSGATALTGVEAISNGVPAFRRPQAKNAANTLLMMGVMSITMYLGISFLATHIDGVTVSEERTVIAQISEAVLGGGSGFYIIQFFTAAILILAANTAYQDFPRLSSILARDRFMPRQFMNRGDRLVFSNGIIVLSLIASLVIFAFDANLTRLIQLYVVGVFTSFTLSQSGMIVHWLRERHKGDEAAKGWRRSIVINAIGAFTTGVVLIVVTVTKFAGGAWLSLLSMAILVPLLLSVHRHYSSVMRQLRRGVVSPGRVGANHVVLVVRDLDVATAEAIGYVRASRPEEFLAVFPSRTGQVPPEIRRRWREFAVGAAPDLEGIPMKGDDLLDAIRPFVQRVRRDPDDFVTVAIPELIGERLPWYLVRRRSLIRLKAGLLRERNIVVADAPVLLERGESVAVDGRPLIPERVVALVFVSAVHDATVRAVNYARSLGAAETRAIYFDLDPEAAHRMVEEWSAKGLGIPLDIVEAPFRDLTGPMQDEIRRYTGRGDTVCAVVLPEFVLRKWRHLLLHNQNALFVKRELLYEPRVVLSSVPFVIEKDEGEKRRPAPEPATT
jgi:amino acid transporter